MKGNRSIRVALAFAGIMMLGLAIPEGNGIAPGAHMLTASEGWNTGIEKHPDNLQKQIDHAHSVAENTLKTLKEPFKVSSTAAAAGAKEPTGIGQRADSAKGPVAEPVRGIYVSGYAAGSPKAMGRLRDLAKRTEINAMVIDVKDDYGLLTYPSKVRLAHRIGADRRPLMAQPTQLIDELHAEGLYVIGRLVVFKDAWLASRVPDWALHEQSGKVWRDSKGKAWINPYRSEVWNYNIAIAQEAAELGFDEIQFDYVRFPANGKRAEAVIDYGSHGTNKSEAIGQFLGRARDKLHGKPISADVFGLVTSSSDDMGIGQTWRSVASSVDAISPMVYPSHYSAGMYGIPQPDLNPSAVIRKSMSDAAARNRYLIQSGIKPAQIRPWLQSFTATWLHPHLAYGEKEIREQIRAAREAGVDQYLLWSPRCIYPLTDEHQG
ncbi:MULTISPECIES: putative glycoside hydrolase [Paenibacillus]|uniref:putative glycoside hydrolase n=1 Tax=Paenibacillus TaxID=44249 RepID=UPI000B24DB6F|nr:MULTISPECIES: putative glycoside hydrolase [Paenibacillus]